MAELNCKEIESLRKTLSGFEDGHGHTLDVYTNAICDMALAYLDSTLGMGIVGVKSLTIKRDGDSFRVWLTTDAGMEVSLAHCPLRDDQIVIALDSANVKIRTWPAPPEQEERR